MAEPPVPVDVPDEDNEDEEDVVSVGLSPEGGYLLYQTLEAVRAHRLYPYNYQAPLPESVAEDRADLEDLRKLLRKNRHVRQVRDGERHG